VPVDDFRKGLGLYNGVIRLSVPTRNCESFDSSSPASVISRCHFLFMEIQVLTQIVKAPLVHVSRGMAP